LSDIKKNSLASCSVPLVITGQNFEGLPCVYHDDFNAVRELTELLVRKGARRIVYIGVLEEDKAAGLARREGCQEALRSAGLDADNLPRRMADFEAQSGYSTMLELLAENPDLDGVICATDIIAHGAMKALKENGRRIPEDVKIAGVGDNWSDLISTPSLTTAKLHQKLCGSEAARLLLRLIEEEESGEAADSSIRHEGIKLGYRIIERESL
jgi:LacI family sucrose operon transcriptional repressor